MSAIRCNDGSIICCDNGRHDIMDEAGEVIEAQEDAALARVVADAVCKALAAHRKAAKDALPDPKDHRHDFDPNARKGVTERQHHNIFDAAMDGGFANLDALFCVPVQRRGLEARESRGAQDSAMGHHGDLLDLDAMFAAPVRN